MLLAPLGAAALSRAAEADIRRDAVVAAVEQVMPSVVNIATETVVEYHDFYENLLRDFYGWRGLPRRQQRSTSLGSGVITDEDGYVLTNFHVVRRASRIQVKLWDGREYEAQPLVYTEASDIAILKLRAKPGEKFKAMKLAADDDLLLGETVLALGNPFGLGGSVTKGILSSKNRRPATGNEPLNVEDWLQTDAAINPGNSGGPLVNLRGELIGLNVAVYREQDGQRGMGVGFSIPVKQISTALSRFFTPENTDSVWFGAQLKPGLGPLVVTAVQPDSPAAKAGLRQGDEVLEVEGQQPRGLISFNRMLSSAPGYQARLQVKNGRDRRNLRVHLVPFAVMISERLGVKLAALTPETAESFAVRPDQAMVITEVQKDGPAAAAGLQKGSVLTGIAGQPAKDLRAVGEILSGSKPGDAVALSVIVARRVGGSFLELRQGTIDVRVR